MRKRTRLILMCVCIFTVFSGNAVGDTSNMQSLVPGRTPDGWILKGDPQLFTKETLFEHINGQADLFLQYGFKGSIFARYQNKKSNEEQIDLDIYDMGDVVHAFGIFSRFRQGGHSGGVGLASSFEDNYAVFYKGKFFVVLQATDSSTAALKQLARTVESRITDNSAPPKEISFFPKRWLNTDSIEYYPQGLMGRQFLKRGFKGTYSVPDGRKAQADGVNESHESSLFLAVFDSPKEAGSSLKSFKEDFAKRGSSQLPVHTQSGFDTVTGDDAYQGKLMILQKGRYLVGAAGFEREEDAQGLIGELIEHID